MDLDPRTQLKGLYFQNSVGNQHPAYFSTKVIDAKKRVASGLVTASDSEARKL